LACLPVTGIAFSWLFSGFYMVVLTGVLLWLKSSSNTIKRISAGHSGIFESRPIKSGKTA